MAKRFHGIGDFVRPLWPFAINRDSPQAQGLVRWWPLGLGFAYYDLVAGIRAAPNGNVTVATDPVMRQAYIGDASGDKLTVVDAAVTAVPLSLCTWSYQTGAGEEGSLAIDDGDIDGCFTIGIAGTGAYRARTQTAAATGQASSATTRISNAWTHICGVFSGVAARSVFVNGGSKGTDTTSVTPTGIANTVIGCRATDEAATWTGMLADARIYNRALTDLEAASYFSDPRLSLDLYYPLGRRVWSFPKSVAASFIPYPRPRGLEAGLSVLTGGMQ